MPSLFGVRRGLFHSEGNFTSTGHEDVHAVPVWARRGLLYSEVTSTGHKNVHAVALRVLAGEILADNVKYLPDARTMPDRIYPSARTVGATHPAVCLVLCRACMVVNRWSVGRSAGPPRAYPNGLKEPAEDVKLRNSTPTKAPRISVTTPFESPSHHSTAAPQTLPIRGAPEMHRQSDICAPRVSRPGYRTTPRSRAGVPCSTCDGTRYTAHGSKASGASLDRRPLHGDASSQRSACTALTRSWRSP